MVKRITDLPIIPDKKYFTIGEASDLCGVKPHVLRYWEQEFPQIDPAKRRGGRRYYTKDDIESIRTIRELLYFKGFTIAGAMLQLKTTVVGTKHPSIEHTEQYRTEQCSVSAIKKDDFVIKDVVNELENLLREIKYGA